MTKLIRLRVALTATTAIAGGMLFAVPALAQNLPDSSSVTSTTAGMSGGVPGSTNPVITTPTPTSMKVDLRDNRTVLNWGGTGFDVAAGYGVTFTDGRATTGVTGRTDNIAVLNRDLSGGISNISGSITSDPNVAVYLINTNGIIFGGSAVVNTGAFFASTLDLTDTDFLDGDSNLSFSTAGGSAITSNTGAQFTTAGNAGATGGRMGDMVFLSSLIAADGSFRATGGDLGFVVARDVRVQNAAGSPLSFTISAGAAQPVGGVAGLTFGGTAQGRNVTFAAVGDASFLGLAMNLNSATIIATGATATDSGVVLTASKSAPGVTIADGTIVGPGAGIRALNSAIISSSGVNVAAGGHFQLGSIEATGAVDLDANGAPFEFGNASTTTGSITGRSVTIRGGDRIASGFVTTTGGDLIVSNLGFQAPGAQVAGNLIGTLNTIPAFPNYTQFEIWGTTTVTGSVSVTAGRVNLGNLQAGGNILLANTYADGRTRAGSIVSTAGNVDLSGPGAIVVDSVSAAGSLSAISDKEVDLTTATAATGINIGSNTASVFLGTIFVTGADADLTINGRLLSGGSLTATRDITITAAGSGANFTFADAGRNVSVTAQSVISSSRLKAISGSVTVESYAYGYPTTGNHVTIRIGTLVAGTSASVTGFGVKLDNATVGTTLALSGSNNVQLTHDIHAGDVTITGGDTILDGGVYSGGDVLITGRRLQAGRVDAAGSLTMNASETLQLTNGTAVGSIALTSTSTGATGQFRLGTVSASGATSDLTISGGNLVALTGDRIGALSAGRDIEIIATNERTAMFDTVVAGRNASISTTFAIEANRVEGTNGSVSITTNQAGTASTVAIGAIFAGSNVDVIGNGMSFGTIDAAAGYVSLTSTSNSLRIGAVAAGGNITASSANGTLTARGDIDAGGDVTLSGTEVTFGATGSSTPLTLKAKGAFNANATTGNISNALS